MTVWPTARRRTRSTSRAGGTRRRRGTAGPGTSTACGTVHHHYCGTTCRPPCPSTLPDGGGSSRGGSALSSWVARAGTAGRCRGSVRRGRAGGIPIPQSSDELAAEDREKWYSDPSTNGGARFYPAALGHGAAISHNSALMPRSRMRGVVVAGEDCCLTNFTCLVGIPLSDMSEEGAGNVGLMRGRCSLPQPACSALACFVPARGVVALCQTDCTNH